MYKDITLKVTEDGTIWVVRDGEPVSTETIIDPMKTEKENFESALSFFFKALEA